MRAARASLVGVLLTGAAVAAPAPEAALRDEPLPRIEIVPDRPPAEQPRRAGNPLWSIPLRTLTATRERPIFSPSRRPPAPAVANVPFVAPAAPPPPAAPEPLMLLLIGTISGEAESLAILIDTGTNQVLRLRTGDAYSGWVLKSVHGREVTVEKDRRTETLRLPKATDAPNAPRPPGLPAVPTSNAEPL